MPETFTYLWGALRVDVDKAKMLVTSRKRQRIAIVNYSPERFGVYVDKKKLAMIPRPFEPGIMGVFRFWDKKARKYIRQHLVIDGSHRATVCNEEGAKFYCHILSVKESEAVTKYNAMTRQ
jgi:hypothetical protein